MLRIERLSWKEHEVFWSASCGLSPFRRLIVLFRYPDQTYTIDVFGYAVCGVKKEFKHVGALEAECIFNHYKVHMLTAAIRELINFIKSLRKN